jgi:pimeloyl-ACP methyl ester carboxylesterase
VSPFEIDIDEAVLADLRDRLRRTRWPDGAETGWTQGVDLGYLRELTEAWERFDWPAAQRRLNGHPQVSAAVGGARIHALHVRGHGPDPLPLVLTHGWPSSFCEYLAIIPLLTDPAAHGADPADAFHVVAPSLPGFAFSTRPSTPALTNVDIADLWARLMTDHLGYEKFAAHGSDIGAGVTIRLGQRHPSHVVGIHVSAANLGAPEPPMTDAERAYTEAVERWSADHGAYAHVHATTPQTLGYALNDSPVGLAAWLVSRYRDWSDSGGDPESSVGREHLLTTLTLYWATGTIASSTRLYHDHRHHGRALGPGDRVPVPAGFALFPHEFVPMPSPPRELAERRFDVRRWRELPSGGHFPALEAPEVLAEEIRAFFRPLRG